MLLRNTEGDQMAARGREWPKPYRDVVISCVCIFLIFTNSNASFTGGKVFFYRS